MTAFLIATRLPSGTRLAPYGKQSLAPWGADAWRANSSLWVATIDVKHGECAAMAHLENRSVSIDWLMADSEAASLTSAGVRLGPRPQMTKQTKH